MKNLKLFQVLLITAAGCLIASFSGCDHGDECDNVYRLSDDFKAYTMFPVGSYWVYADSTGLKVDSLYLVSQKIIITDYSEEDGMCNEELQQHLYSSQYDTIIFGQSGPFNMNLSSIYYISNNIYTDGLVSGETEHYINYDKIDSLIINSVKYFDVKFFKRYNYESFWVENIGLIKKTVSINILDFDSLIELNLIRYHINN